MPGVAHHVTQRGNHQETVFFDDGDRVEVSTERQGVRFLLVSGKRIGEPVAWYGPIVMNTQEQLQQAFRELEQGTFLKRDGDS